MLKMKTSNVFFAALPAALLTALLTFTAAGCARTEIKRAELANGARLGYIDSGTGRPVVFVHGWSGSKATWNKVSKALAGSYRCIAYDHRGGSDSAYLPDGEPVTLRVLADDLAGLISSLGLRDVTLVGYSMGAAVVMQYVESYGCGNLHSIVLVDMTPKVMNDGEWKLGRHKGAFTEASAQADYARIQADFKKFSIDFASLSSPRIAKLPGFLKKFLIGQIIRRNSEKALIDEWLSSNLTDYRAGLASWTVPVGYFYADPGTFYAPGLAEYYKSVFTAVPFTPVAFPGGSHLLISEFPDKFARELAAFLAK